MSLDQTLQAGAPTPEQIAAALDDLHLAVNFHSPYLSLRTAAAYCGRSVNAFVKFAAKHGLQRFGDGTYRRADLDQIKRQLFRTGRGRSLRTRPSRRQQRSA